MSSPRLPLKGCKATNETLRYETDFQSYETPEATKTKNTTQTITIQLLNKCKKGVNKLLTRWHISTKSSCVRTQFDFFLHSIVIRRNFALEKNETQETLLRKRNVIYDDYENLIK